ncbi:hypothetical protein [Hoeflea ulvae]|uniref:Uncharacterized protein n=1 Tax=Hoeflea ulvae TaxID=2983764 RepID=A0ABT3YBB8_9HYPH|nr:hypothetical protein [Hoeflea ulvae]MCY0093176.1 hypothetical protein [Hoeflea ulvae]
MQIEIHIRGARARPVSHVRSTRALREEDEFMELHGGTGSRLIYLAVEGVAWCAGAPLRAAKWLLRRRAMDRTTAKAPDIHPPRRPAHMA